MVITESELRELWRDGKHPLPSFPAGTRFTPAAHDFLRAHQLEIRYEAAGVRQTPAAPAPLASPTVPTWDKPAAFPVVLTGALPVCNVCGQAVKHKPDHLTQLDAHSFAPKTHPRIKVRGQLDTLNALLMLVAAEARRFQLPRLAAGLDTLAAYAREIQAAEYHARPVQALSVLGHSEDQIHQISHWPEKLAGVAHLTPGPHDHAIMHWLNYARAATREVEISVLEAYPAPERADLARAVNRLSSAVYVLAVWFQAGRLSWDGWK